MFLCYCSVLLVKRGAFLPARKYVSAPIASLLTFLVSGFTHEYLTSVMYSTNKDPSVAPPTYYKMTAFFLVNGIGFLLERPLARTPLCRWASKHLPIPIVSTFTILWALPFLHWFASDWIQIGFYEGLSLGFWRIVRL